MSPAKLPKQLGRPKQTVVTYYQVCVLGKPRAQPALEAGEGDSMEQLPELVDKWWQILSQDAQISSYALFLGMSVRVFLEEISIWVKKICPHQCGDPKENKKMKGEWIPSPWIRGETFMIEAWKWHTSFLPIWHLLEFSHVGISNCRGGGEAGKCGLAAHGEEGMGLADQQHSLP